MTVKNKPKSNEGRRVKHYTVDEAIRMLPYIQSYCRDVAYVFSKIENLIYRYYRLNSLITTSPVKEEKRVKLMLLIENKIQTWQDRYEEWVKDLAELYCCVCEPAHGFVDVPIYSKSLNNVIYMCVNIHSVLENVSWHRLDEGCHDCRPFEWAIESEITAR